MFDGGFKDINLFLNFRRMRHINRCNNFLKINSEDVAQHSYYTVFLTMIICDELNDRNYSIDTETALRKALLHDIEESITSDIPYTIKHHSLETEQLFQKITPEIVNDAFSSCTARFERYKELLLTSKDDIEGVIVGVADMAELGVYCYEEFLLGNRQFADMYKRVRAFLRDSWVFEESVFLKQLLKYMDTTPLDSCNMQIL